MSRTDLDPTTAPAPSPTRSASAARPSPTVPLTVAGLGLALSAIPGVTIFFDAAPFSEIAGTPGHYATYTLALVGLVALVVATPRLVALRRDRPLPAGLLATAVVATVLNAATVYTQLFVVTDLARHVPAYLDEQAPGMTMVGMVGAWLLHLAAWVAVGAVALRRKAVPVPAGVLVIVGAVLQPAVGPIAGLPFGLGLLLLARAARPR